MAMAKDMNTLGVFSQPGSIDIGDAYAKEHKVPQRYLGKQFLTHGTKWGQNPDSMIDGEFKRISEGDQYVDPGAHERKERAGRKLKNVSEKPFYPSKPPTKSYHMKGSLYGCIGEKAPHMKEFDEDAEKAAARAPTPKQIYTNPGKKGTYGVPLTTIGKPLDLMDEPYLVGRELEKVERKVAREKIPSSKGFISTHMSQTGLFDNSIYAYNAGDWAEKPKEKKPTLEKSFRPTHPPKKGFNCTINKFPEYTEDPEEIKLKEAKEERAAERAKKTVKGVFYPNKGPKSKPTTELNPLDFTGPAPCSLADSLG